MMTDQPTPTSSLEEARTDLLTGAEEHTRNGGDWSEERTHNGCVCCCDTCDFNTERLVAAARAEVIREVEAALSEHDARLARGYYWPTSAIQLVERLRALSQGGEGASQ